MLSHAATQFKALLCGTAVVALQRRAVAPLQDDRLIIEPTDPVFLGITPSLQSGQPSALFPTNQSK